MEWFRELYDDFRQRTGFGSLPADRTVRDVDFIMAECQVGPGDRVLDICSGTGRHSIELELRGVHAVGVELNPDYVEMSRARAQAVDVTPTFKVGDVRSVDLGSEFDAAILMWNSFGYFSDSDNRELLRRLRGALRPHGRFLLELLNRDFLLRNFEPRAEHEVDGVRVVEERDFDALTSRMHSVITRYEGEHVVIRKVAWRLYSPHELVEMGSSVGLELLAAFGDLKRNPVTLEARLLRLVFERQ